MNTLAADRLESLKAGLCAAVAATLTDAGVALVVTETPLTLLLRLAIVGASGFLFGVTYRYAVRRDTNPQLKSGAVGAFGLVRGLALLENAMSRGAISDGTIAIALLSLLESLGLFAVAGLCLDWALQQGWIAPMDASTEPRD